ncbi:MAG: hypothetical protein U1E40_13080 [Amaricoccus sp.]
MALLVDPRFPGGTGAAVAAEIRALAPRLDLKVHAISSALFRDRPPNPAIVGALEEIGQRLLPEPPVVHADVIVLHNPTCLRFDSRLRPRLSAPRTIVVTHENFVRPDGSEGFDVAHCLGLVAEQTAGEKILAPVSEGNRASVAAWLARRPGSAWRLAADDWPNICDLPFLSPTSSPRDRRGRHSRPGIEKFPPLAAMRVQFPPHAERCAILGADNLIPEREDLPPHWQLLPFGSVRVADFLAGIDFFVYFTHPLLRESYGRAIAEAIAAGKLVITDPGTAEAFGPGVVADEGGGVDGIVAAHIADPGRYAAAVLRAQADLARHRPELVADRLLALIESEIAVDAFL